MILPHYSRIAWVLPAQLLAPLCSPWGNWWHVCLNVSALRCDFTIHAATIPSNGLHHYALFLSATKQECSLQQCLLQDPVRIMSISQSVKLWKIQWMVYTSLEMPMQMQTFVMQGGAKSWNQGVEILIHAVMLGGEVNHDMVMSLLGLLDRCNAIQSAIQLLEASIEEVSISIKSTSCS